MVLHKITLAPLDEEIRAADSGLLSPFYADDVALNGPERRSSQILKILIERGRTGGIYLIWTRQFLSWIQWGKRTGRGGNFWRRV